MVDKTVTQAPNVIELARYRARAEGSRAPALSSASAAIAAPD